MGLNDAQALMCLPGNPDNGLTTCPLETQCCLWQTFASVSEKQLLEGFLHSSFKGHPIVPYLPRYWRIYSHGIGDIWLEIIDKTVTSEHVLS